MHHHSFREEDLAVLLRARYDLAWPLRCSLIQASFNSHFLIEVGSQERPRQRYVLRVYRGGTAAIHHEADIQFELELLIFLAGRGLPVAAPVPSRDGELLGWLESLGGAVPYVLFDLVPGQPIYGNEEVEDPVAACLELGSLVARLHLAADEFQPHRHRQMLDLEALIEEPLRLLEEALREQGREGLDFFRPCAEELKAEIGKVPESEGLHGIIHGDLHGENITYDRETGFWFYDFEHCSYGWRSYELAFLGATFEELFQPFLEGYETVRPVAQVEREAFLAFAKTRAVWEVGDELRRATQQEGVEPMADLLDRLREKLATLI